MVELDWIFRDGIPERVVVGVVGKKEWVIGNNTLYYVIADKFHYLFKVKHCPNSNYIVYQYVAMI